MGELPRKPGTFDAYYLDDFTSLTWFAIRIGASSRAEAEDVTQEVMRTVLCHWAEIEAPYAYARAAVRREIIRVKTRTMRRRDAEASASAQNRHWQPAPFDEDTTLVLAMLNTLSPAQKAVIALTTDGFKPGEIAEITGQNTVTVRSNLRHARRKLLRLMTEAAGKKADDGP